LVKQAVRDEMPKISHEFIQQKQRREFNSHYFQNNPMISPQKLCKDVVYLFVVPKLGFPWILLPEAL